MPPSHRKHVKRFHRPGELHELTSSTYRQLPLLTNDLWRSWLAEAITQAGEKQNCRLVAFVFMPEHVHLLVLPLTPDERTISRYLASLKRPVSVHVREALHAAGSSLLDRLTIQERPGKTVFRFWQEGGGYDRNLNREQTILSSIAYIHENPVRRDLCEKATDWKWSSARWFVSEGKIIDPDLPRIDGPPAEMFS